MWNAPDCFFLKWWISLLHSHYLGCHAMLRDDPNNSYWLSPTENPGSSNYTLFTGTCYKCVPPLCVFQTFLLIYPTSNGDLLIKQSTKGRIQLSCLHHKFHNSLIPWMVILVWPSHEITSTLYIVVIPWTIRRCRGLKVSTLHSRLSGLGLSSG